MMIPLQDFVAESNRIEGITRPPSSGEIMAHAHFLSAKVVVVEDLRKLVSATQPGAALRTQPGLNVRVGRHIAPDGGPAIEPALAEILEDARTRKTAFEIHVAYETLHPFTDGNGRSGRALWLWMMLRRGPYPGLGFLHTFYYQTLEAIGR